MWSQLCRESFCIHWQNIMKGTCKDVSIHRKLRQQVFEESYAIMFSFCHGNDANRGHISWSDGGVWSQYVARLLGAPAMVPLKEAGQGCATFLAEASFTSEVGARLRSEMERWGKDDL